MDHMSNNPASLRNGIRIVHRWRRGTALSPLICDASKLNDQKERSSSPNSPRSTEDLAKIKGDGRPLFPYIGELHQPDDLLLPSEAASILRLSEKTLANWRWKGNGPAFVQVAENRIRYRFQDLIDFVSSRRRSNTSQNGEEAGR